MAKDSIEWIKQADYDIETAQAMFDSDRYFYAVFMCHLCIEKALKGVYQTKLKKMPPRVHNLVSLLNKIDLKPKETIGRFIVKLNEASVVTRYPEDIEKLQSDYNKEVVYDILLNSKEALSWIKEQL